jgi:hypothetical protein
MGEARRRDAAGREPPKKRTLPFETLAQAFVMLQAVALPPDAPPAAVDMLRRFFHYGAAAFFDIQMHHMEPGDGVTEADMQRMTRLHAEIDHFAAELRVAVVNRHMANPPTEPSN